MRRPSVANQLREDLAREVEALSTSERIDLALRLGDESLELLAAQGGISTAEAKREREAIKQAGRRSSRCIGALTA
jgi:hypothetical protein